MNVYNSCISKSWIIFLLGRVQKGKYNIGLLSYRTIHTHDSDSPESTSVTYSSIPIPFSHCSPCLELPILPLVTTNLFVSQGWNQRSYASIHYIYIHITHTYIHTYIQVYTINKYIIIIIRHTLCIIINTSDISVNDINLPDIEFTKGEQNYTTPIARTRSAINWINLYCQY